MGKVNSARSRLQEATWCWNWWSERPGLAGRLVGVNSAAVLRPLEETDWEAVHAWAELEQVYRYQIWGPNSPEQTKAFVHEAVSAWRASPRTRLVYAITLDGKVVGTCELHLHGNRQGEISYGLHPDYWGRGLATSAGRQLLHLGFSVHGRHRIFATCDPRNVRSAAVLRRLGMTYEGRLRETQLIRDGWRDSDIYSVIVHEWRDGGSD